MDIRGRSPRMSIYNVSGYHGLIRIITIFVSYLSTNISMLYMVNSTVTLVTFKASFETSKFNSDRTLLYFGTIFGVKVKERWSIAL